MAVLPGAGDAGWLRRLLPMALGLLAITIGTVAGWDRALNELLVSPPPFIRVLLGTAAGLLGLVLVARASERLGEASGPATLVRSVRIVFLAVAAFAAAAGWFLASPLPIIAGLVIAGIDVLETSFLLLVTAVRADPGT
ncbi:MAG: hypothetical protein H0W07_06655 [Chloroflexi bacterium]|nr:hypothetical protein [Chloroflexota bacterium]